MDDGAVESSSGPDDTDHQHEERIADRDVVVGKGNVLLLLLDHHHYHYQYNNAHGDDHYDKFHRFWGVLTDNTRWEIRWDKTCSNNRAHGCFGIADEHRHFGGGFSVAVMLLAGENEIAHVHHNRTGTGTGIRNRTGTRSHGNAAVAVAVAVVALPNDTVRNLDTKESASSKTCIVVWP